MTPYWQSADGAITVYHARWEDVHAAGLVGKPDLIHADPPYGIDYDPNEPWRSSESREGIVKYEKVANDHVEYDPSPLLALDSPTIMWGANNFSSRLPDVAAWLCWDKVVRNGLRMRIAEFELAWCNITRRSQCFRHMWSGAFRESERGTKYHPTQKPVALSTWVFQRAKLKPGALVFVPYLGSGPDLPAAQAMGLRVVACDVERWCCDTAIGRLGTITRERAAEPVGPLFAQPA